jgi:hypothetical protein
LVVLPWVKAGPFTVAGTWNYFVVFGSWLFAFFGLYSVFLVKEMNRRKAGLSAGQAMVPGAPAPA